MLKRGWLKRQFNAVEKEALASIHLQLLKLSGNNLVIESMVDRMHTEKQIERDQFNNYQV